MFKKFGALVTVALIIMAVAGCGGSKDQPAAKKAATGLPSSVKVGVVLPLSGNNAYDGRLTSEGIKMAADEINAKGGIAGTTKIELVIEDSRGVPAEAVNVMEKLTNVVKVSAVIGDFGSSNTLAMMPVAQREKISLITPISMAPKITQQSNTWIFRTADNSDINAVAFAKYAVNDLKLKKWAFIAVNDDYGRGSVDAFKNRVASLGAAVVFTEYYDHGETDFYTILTKLKALDADGLCLFGQVQDLSRAVNQFAELGLDKKMKLMDPTAGLLSQQFMELTKGHAEGMIGAIPFVDALDTPKAKQFVETYKAKYGYGPQKYANAGYLTVHLLAEAIAQAKSVDRTAIRDALSKVQYEGPQGKVSFDKNNQLIVDEWIITYKGGKFAIVGGPIKVDSVTLK